MSLFGKKKEVKSVPLDEIRRMLASGINDKDVIRDLKKRGYKYQDIEKAMLQVIKEGIGNPSTGLQSAEPTIPMETEMKTTRVMPQTSQSIQKTEGIPSIEELVPPIQQEAEEIHPEVLIEEVVEGIVQEKLNQIGKEVKNYENEINSLKGVLKNLEQRIEQTKTEPFVKDIEPRFAEVIIRLDDVEARIGGLEKAFKQFLPSLTQNIESLSNLIHEMKEKHGMVAEA